MDRTLVIKIFNQKIWFNADEQISLASTNLPMKLIQFRHAPVFWKMEMTVFDKSKSSLTVQVVDYDSRDSDSWKRQIAKFRVLNLVFVNLEWKKLESCLSFYEGSAKSYLFQDESIVPPQSVSRLTVLNHTVSISKLTIGNGMIHYTKKVPWNRAGANFSFSHRLMIPAFDVIKPYFTKLLKRAKVNVEVTVQQEGDAIRIRNVRCVDFESINEKSLHVIRDMQISDFRKSTKDRWRDNILLDSDVMADEGMLGNVDAIERDLLFHFIEKDDVRNGPQLRYLIDLQQSNIALMITVEPQFGFVFCIYGEQMVHCIWELVNSHATYIWSFDSDVFDKRCLLLLEGQFSSITSQGRTAYRQQFSADQELYFHVVQHESSTNPMVDALGRWRLNIDRLLV